MSGGGFVRAVLGWLLLLAIMGTLVAACMFAPDPAGRVWLAILLGVVWVPSTMRWVWLLEQSGEQH